MGLSSFLSGLAGLVQSTPRTPQAGQTAKVGKAETATPAQLGNALTPAAHAGTAAPVGYTVHGADLPSGAQAIPAPRSPNRYRARAVYGMGAGPATNAADSPVPGEHAGGGQADPRDAFGGGAGMTGPAEQLRPIPEQLTNEPAALEVLGRSGADAPTTYRAGSTGADPSRPSRRPFVSWLRPFDQWAVYGPNSTPKLPLVLSVSTPLSYADEVAGGQPSPGGSGATTQAGIGTQPNSFRLMPNKWDQNAVNTGGPLADQLGDTGAAAISSRRAGGWRAR